MTAQIIHFPDHRTCFRCIHYLPGYCLMFDEEIDSEIQAAKDCNAYEPEGGPDGDQ